MVRVWVSKIKISDGTEVDVGKNDIVVFVGPNNSGKSVALNNIYTGVIDPKDEYTNKVVIKNISLNKEGTYEEIINHLESNSIIQNNINYVTYRFGPGGIDSRYVPGTWQNIGNNGLKDLASLFSIILPTGSRLNGANNANNISITKEPPAHPIHIIQRDEKLEYKFSDLFKKAFGYDVIIHHNAGNLVPLYVGNRPDLEDNDNRFSFNYLQKLEKLPYLETQGDGMRSFSTILLYTFNSIYNIILIDEPEAFLHPPQAKLLGSMLAKELPTDRQLFLSTHSEDFLKGLLDSGNQNIKVIRLKRDGDINHATLLNQDDINSIWSDPLLRYSNILSGLFHNKVVICESDADCRFYSALLSSIFEDYDTAMPDILFVHCGGKHRMPTVVKALKKVNVPVYVIPDFDVLNDEYPLRAIITELGGNWDDIKADWKLVKDAIESKKPELEKDELKKKIDEAFDTIITPTMPDKKLEEVRKLLKKASAWAYAKETGKAFIPSGDASRAFERINEYFKTIGLNIVEIGEIEGFVKSVGGHGPAWLNGVLQKDLKIDQELETARQFVKRLI